MECKLDRKKDLNVLYQVSVRADRKNKIAALSDPSKVAYCTQVHDM